MDRHPDANCEIKPATHAALEELALGLHSRIAQAGARVPEVVARALSPGLDEFFAGIQAATESLTPVVEQLRAGFKDPFTPEWLTSFLALPDAMRDQQRKYAEIAIRLKWFAPDNLPHTVVGYFVEVSEREENEALIIQHLFLRHFRENHWEELRKFVDRWRGMDVLPRAHWNTMRDSARLMVNHGVNRCNAAAVVIPAIIPVLDYLLITFARVDLQLPEHVVKQSRDVEIRKALETLDPSVAAFDEPARALAFDVLFERAYSGQTPRLSETFNRHKIVHGESLRHGTAANALRAFFLVDFLVRAISEYREHKPTQKMAWGQAEEFRSVSAVVGAQLTRVGKAPRTLRS
jgi:hypothetical protein